MQNAYQDLMLKAAKDEAFRGALLNDPKATIAAHLGTQLPENLTVRVVENTATELTLVIPPKLTAELKDEQLQTVSGGVDGWDVFYSFGTLGFGCMASAIFSSVRECRSYDQNW